MDGLNTRYSYQSAPAFTSTVSSLPAYSARPPPPLELTRETSPRALTTHQYELLNRNQRPWATLKIKSLSGSPKNLPNVFEGTPVTGSVDLNFEREESVKCVKISFQGRIHLSANEKIPFVTISTDLWFIDRGDPASPSPSTSNLKYTGKFKAGAQEEFSLPPSYYEKTMKCTIDYRIFATIKRGFLNTKCEVGTTVVYTPIIIPEPFSCLRQLAYQQGSRLVGPEGDPEGWLSLEPIMLRGTAFNSRNTEAELVLSLAKPLSYTRGSIIPLHLTITSSDIQALDLLAHPRAIDIRLRRTVLLDENSYHDPIFSFVGIGSDNISRDEAHAAWWPPLAHSNDHDEGDNAQRVNVGNGEKRVLDGEIRLDSNLFPSCRMGDFGIFYAIHIHPSSAVAFKLNVSVTSSPASVSSLSKSSSTQSHKSSSVLLSHPVEIVTAYSSGPRPKSYAPPAYGTDGLSSSSPRREVPTTFRQEQAFF
ncbi:hypothetical protein ABKN59_006122 [Abortiporus biennis]